MQAMANAAPYLAAPFQRLVAGAADFVLCLGGTFIGWGMIVRATYAQTAVELALLNPAPFFVYAAYHTLCIWRFNGQSLGRHLADIQVVKASGGPNLSLAQAAIRGGFRPLLVYLCAKAAVMAQSAFEPAAYVAALPLLVELGMMFTLPSRQTLSDVISRTLVVNVPPPQPHRAPAAPMYSRTDAEFGVPPHRK
jgi:uncharacterized RDD family membrane protein YckC